MEYEQRFARTALNQGQIGPCNLDRFFPPFLSCHWCGALLLFAFARGLQRHAALPIGNSPTGCSAFRQINRCLNAHSYNSASEVAARDSMSTTLSATYVLNHRAIGLLGHLFTGSLNH